jgi:hypothetical protein
MQYLPVAKVPIFFALWGLFRALGKTKRTFRDLPKMADLLLYMILIMYVGALSSPIWRGGALNRTIDFSKIYHSIGSRNRKRFVVDILTFYLPRRIQPTEMRRTNTKNQATRIATVLFNTDSTFTRSTFRDSTFRYSSLRSLSSSSRPLVCSQGVHSCILQFPGNGFNHQGLA